MKNYITLRNVFYFWGMLDLFYIMRFIWLNIEQGRIPLIDDVLNFSSIFPQQGVYSLFIFILSLLLNVSIIFSSLLLLKKWKNAYWLIYFQTPLRVLFFIPSLSFLPWFFKTFSLPIGGLFILTTVISEVLKVVTISMAKESEVNTQEKGVESK